MKCLLFWFAFTGWSVGGIRLALISFLPADPHIPSPIVLLWHFFSPHIFYIENAFMAKNSHKRQKAPNKDISVSRILSKFQCHVGGNAPPLGSDKKCYQSLSWLTQVAQVLMCGFAFKWIIFQAMPMSCTQSKKHNRKQVLMLNYCAVWWYAMCYW